MLKSEFVQLVAKLLAERSFKIPQRDVDQVLDVFLEAIAETLQRGERVEFRGFGVFERKFRPEREGRNPRTQEVVHIPACYVPSFRPGKDLRNCLNAEPKKVATGAQKGAKASKAKEKKGSKKS